MLDATINSNLFVPVDDGGISIDLSRLENIQLQHQAAIEGVDFEALLENLTSVAANAVEWSSGSTVLILSGSGIGPVGTAEELMEAVNQGTANGTLTDLSLSVAGTEILHIDISSSNLTISSGIHSVSLDMALPQNLGQLLELSSLSLDLDQIATMEAQDFQDVVDGLQNYGIQGLQFSEGSEELLALTFGGDNFASLTALGYELAVQGALPNQFGALLTAIREIAQAEDNLDGSDAVAINGLTLTGPDGTLLLQVSGAVSNLDDAGVDAVTIQGSTGDDLFDPYEAQFGWSDIADLTSDNDGAVSVQLDAGDDWLSGDIGSMGWYQAAGTGDRSISLDGGVDYDTLYLGHWGKVAQIEYQPLYNQQAFYEAGDAATNAAYDAGLYNPIDDAAYQAASDAYWTSTNPTGEPPEQEDFPNGSALIDFAAYAADRALYEAQAIERFGSVEDAERAGEGGPSLWDWAYHLPAPNAPDIAEFRNDVDGFDFDAYEAAIVGAAEAASLELDPDMFFYGGAYSLDSSDFATSFIGSDYFDENFNYLDAVDWDAFSQANNAYWSSQQREGEPPSSADFLINGDLYDHDAIGAYVAQQDAFNAAMPYRETFLAPETTVVDISEGTVSVTVGEGADEEQLVDVSFENFERISLDGENNFEVLGSAGDDHVRVHSLEPTFIEVDGAAGDYDTLQFDRTWINRDTGERGITQELFLDTFDLTNRLDGSIDISFKDTEELFISMQNVEQLRFLVGEGDVEYVPIASLFNGLVLQGTEDEDTLNGSSGDDTIMALGSHDVIRGNGGNDDIDAGDGDDTITVEDGNSTIAGGAGEDEAIASGFDGERMEINFAQGNVDVVAFGPDDETLGSVEGSGIEVIGTDFTDEISVTTDAGGGTVSLLAPPTHLEFTGGTGHDELRFDQMAVEGDFTPGMTQEEFEADIRLTQAEDSEQIVATNRATGEQRGVLEGVDAFVFAGADAPVGIDDLTIYEEAENTGTTDQGDLGPGNQLFTANDEGQSAQGGDGDDDLNGGAGEDTLDGGADNDSVSGGDGADSVSGGDGQDTVAGGVGDDTVNGGDGDDTVDGGAGQDTLEGGEGNDVLTDADGGDFDGGDGNDVAVALSGDNSFEDTGANVPVSVQINDFYCGGYGDDSISTGAGNDVLIADANSIYYFGNDTLDGGLGIDLLQGDGGADVFVFEAGDSTNTQGATDPNEIVGTDIIGKFSLWDIMNVMNDPAGDIRTIQPTGADFEIGIDTVQLKDFDATVVADIQANLGDYLDDSAGNGAIFTAEGVSILFADVSEADLVSAGVNSIFEFI